MSKVVKAVKKGVKSIAGTAKGVLKGDVDDLLNFATVGGSKQLEKAGKKIHGVFKPPKLPDAPGLQGANTSEAAPDVNLAQTEESRRTSGTAKGTRKLRVPLGGLR